ncbi:hypothetical protein OYC64_009003 [Pagothenia borchgrevinki]|uniref:TNFR-Cys domain-containing protein n=1 Tax=Pagothenia borchgrevinki TaxID=8213 RepID=A0ABD2G6I2_PAGBO
MGPYIQSMVTMLAVFVFLGCAYFVAPELSCLSKEYVSKAGCCPMCRKGTIVQRDCSSHAGPLCRRCENGTFMTHPNGLNRCFTCTSCDSGHSLFVLQGCSETTDTVCEVIDGYFCKDVTGTACSAAQKHTTCVPGEWLKEPGTSREDAQCKALSAWLIFRAWCELHGLDNVLRNPGKDEGRNREQRCCLWSFFKKSLHCYSSSIIV